jgi:hypothetical protein
VRLNRHIDTAIEAVLRRDRVMRKLDPGRSRRHHQAHPGGIIRKSDMSMPPQAGAVKTTIAAATTQ